MVFIDSLIELPNTRTWQKVNIQLANFDMASLRVIWFRWRLRSHPANQNVSGAILVRGVGRLWAFI